MLKVIMSWGGAPTGWRGVYQLTNASASTMRFLDGASTRSFRVDRQIQFDGPSFNLAAFNDIDRYGHNYSPTSRDVEFGFRVQWTGYLNVTSPESLPMSARCTGAVAIELDQAELPHLPCTDSQPMTVTTGPLAVGSHTLVVTYIKPPRTRGLMTLTLQATSPVRPWLTSLDTYVIGVVMFVTCHCVPLPCWRRRYQNRT